MVTDMKAAVQIQIVNLVIMKVKQLKKINDYRIIIN